MIEADDTLDGTFPFPAKFLDVRGFRQHYVDVGAGLPIVLLHGEPTWGYLYREIIPLLASRHRVVVPDYAGFGKSGTPDRDYALTTHVDDLEALLVHLDLREVTLVMHDWGGPIGGCVAQRHPDRIARLVVMNAAMSLGRPLEIQMLAANVGKTPYFSWMRRLARTGTIDDVLGEFGTIVLAVMRTLQGFERSDRVDETWLRAYGSPFATPAEARGAIAFPKSVVTGSLRFPPRDPIAVEALRRLPALMIEGMRDRVLLPEHIVPIFEDAFPGAPVVRLAKAGHFLQEDEPQRVAAEIDAFVNAT